MASEPPPSTAVIVPTTRQPGMFEIGELVPGGKAYFEQAVQQYATMLLAEAKNIEDMEHTGSGPAEITAAHVEEAKWVLVRRQRRKVAQGRWVVALRAGQLVASTVMGIGASNLSQTWGALSTVGGVLMASLLFVIEREMSRD